MTPPERHKPSPAPPRPVDPVVQQAIRLSCSYCHDRLEREQTVFCGSCLAPHHAGCFAEHGRCSAPGCLHTLVVRAGDPGPIRPRRAGAWMAAAALLLGLAVVAASVAQPSAAGPALASTPLAEAEPAATLDAARRSQLLRDALDITAEAQAARDAERAKDAAVREQLETRRTSANFQDTPLLEVLDFLRDVAQLNYVIESEARTLIARERLTVSLRLQDVSLASLLTLALSCDDALDFAIEQGVVVIGVECMEGRGELTLEAYDVRDILSGETRERGGFAFDGDGLIELLEQVLGDDLSESSVELAGGMLVARQPEFVHHRVVELLDYLRRGETSRSAEPAWIGRYRQALAERVISLNASEAPLAEVIQSLQEITGLNLTLSVEVDADAQVSLHLQEVLLSDALTLIREQTGLATTFANETLVFAEPCTARGAYELRILDVSDLGWLDEDALTGLVQHGVGEDAWDDPASIWPHRGQLIVNQTATIHGEIAAVLAKLRVSRAAADGNLPREG